MTDSSWFRSLVAGVTDNGRRIEAATLAPDQLRRALSEWHPGRLEIDLRGVDRLAPDIIRLLTMVVTRQRSNGGVVALVNASPSVVRRLMCHGLIELLPSMPWTAQSADASAADPDDIRGAA